MHYVVVLCLQMYFPFFVSFFIFYFEAVKYCIIMIHYAMLKELYIYSCKKQVVFTEQPITTCMLDW